MHMPPLLRKVFTALGVLALTLPGSVEAQLRDIVAKSVSATSSETSLELEFADGDVFTLSFRDGTAYLDGAEIGSYRPDRELETAWRALLGEAMALENGALAERLVAWAPPDDVSGDAAELGAAVDDALERALETLDSEPASDEGTISVSGPDDASVVRMLLASVGRLSALEEALEGLSSDLRIHVDEDVVIAEGEVENRGVVVIDGELRVEGEVRGDIVVVDGVLDLRDSGVVRGEARILDTRVVRNSGTIEGGIVDVLGDEREMERELRDRIREEIREEIRSDLRREIRSVTHLRDDDSFSILSPLRPVIRGVGGVLEKLILIFVLGLVGAGFLAFAGENMDTITETVRRSPGRAAMVGVAGTFLLIPVWVVGLVALVVSIIGIPVAIAWAPLFPLAAALAGLLGYLAVARSTGEWLADSDFPWTGWIRKSNPIITLVGGLVGLLLAFMASHVISIAPFLGFLGSLLFALGVVITVVATQIGFGAVILTRGGRSREYYGAYDPEVAWDAAMGGMEMNLGDDLGSATDEPAAGDDPKAGEGEDDA